MKTWQRRYLRFVQISCATFVLFVVGIFFFAACGDDDDSVSETNETEATTTTADPVDRDYADVEGLNGHVYRVTIDGMPCIAWTEKLGSGHETRTYSGLTCDWNDR